MQISLFTKGKHRFDGNQTKVHDIYAPFPSTTPLEDIAHTICEWSWSPITFQEGYRHGDNFQHARFAVFDIDNDEEHTLSLEDALVFFKDYRHIIATSRSHQIEKNKLITDRYRVIIPFDRDVQDAEVYSTIMLSLRKQWPFIDRRCVDTARFFFPCTDIIAINEEGQMIEADAEFYKTDVVKDIKPKANDAIKDIRDQLTRPTLKFLLEGAEPGQWHSSFFKAVSNLKECGYDEAEIREKLEVMCTAIGSAGLDDHDERNLISIMKRPISERSKEFYETWSKLSQNDSIEPKAIDEEEAPIVRFSDGFAQFADYISDERKSIGEPTGLLGLDKLLGGGFRPGELTVLLANAKSGKNTLYHFLMWTLLANNTPMGYASREIDPMTEVLPNILSLELKHNVWTTKKNAELIEKYKKTAAQWDKLLFAPGYGYFAVDKLKDWIKRCFDQGVRLFWLDHLHYMLLEPEESKEASKLIRAIKALTKELEIHINLIVQPTKMTEFNRNLGLNSLRGGASIGQALDNLLILERFGETDEKNISRLKLEVGRHKLARPGEIFLRYDANDCSFTEQERIVTEIIKPIHGHDVEPITAEKYHQTKNLYRS